jgi:catechol 2,3-dioxygenase-like lactoylglutathione lyase family enzyme
MKKIICGIQQMGIGVPNVQEIWKWYRQNFGINIKVFEEAAEAPLMINYTGGKVQARTATLALSMEGGGGFEIWQFTSRATEKAATPINLGDYGFYACKIKSRNIEKSYAFFSQNKVEIISEITQNNLGKKSFFIKDPNGNLFQIVEGRGFFKDTKHPSYCGGVAGTIIGVSDIDQSLKLYKDILGYSIIEVDETGSIENFNALSREEKLVRRVILAHPEQRKGPFAKLLGPTEIELVQSLDPTGHKKIFENRFWGDWGFIHLCFDIQGMDALKEECEASHFPFTVDSADTFDMGEAGGRFSYIEDPDGTLIEFVETHKVPILKKLGWYINLKNKKQGKHLPNFILHAMGLNKVN